MNGLLALSRAIDAMTERVGRIVYWLVLVVVLISAANAVVRGEVPDYAVVAGSPARIVRRWVEGVGWDPPMRDVTMHKPDGWDDD